ESSLCACIESGHARVERRDDLVEKALCIVQRRRAKLRQRDGEVVARDQLEIGMAGQESLELLRPRPLAPLDRIIDEPEMIGGQFVTAELAHDGGEIEASAPVRGVTAYSALQIAERRLQMRFAAGRRVFGEDVERPAVVTKASPVRLRLVVGEIEHDLARHV